MLNSNEIQKIIPHRYPFLLIDRVDELEKGKRAKGVKAVSANEMQFAGHFPNYHVFPGVLLVEAIAQMGAIAVLSLEENKGKIAFFSGIKNAKFRRQVVPGDILTIEAELIKVRGNFGFSQGTCKIGEEIACECEIIFSIGDA